MSTHLTMITRWPRHARAPRQSQITKSGWSSRQAIPSASLISSGRSWSAIDQPTTRREKASSTTAQYTPPSRVRCWVMSVPDNADPQRVRPGSGTNRRLTRSGAVSASEWRRVQPRHRRRWCTEMTAVLAHQPLDPLAPDPNTVLQPQLGVHTR